MCASSELDSRGGCTSLGVGLDDLELHVLHEIRAGPSAMPALSPLPRSHSRASIAPSATTFHSFIDNDMQKPRASTAVEMAGYFDASVPSTAKYGDVPSLQEMRRHDSGYESLAPRPSYSSHQKTNSSVTTSAKRPKSRPSIHRATRSGPVSHMPNATSRQIFRRRPTSQSLRSHPHQPITFFQFPNFASNQPEADVELVVDTRLAHDLNNSGPYTAAGVQQTQPEPEVAAIPLPPQTMHYWTSDRTRRLEYAAIDAASKGVRGWVMRHVVPDCFVPQDRRCMRFEDDSGSVVRYRIDLEGDEKQECGQRKRRGTWWFRR